MLKKRQLTSREHTMGLDQYAYVKHGDSDSYNEIAYWRKHPNLQGWMERLWHSRGRPSYEGPEQADTDFNGIEIELRYQDLEQLHTDILSGEMAKLATTGFFYGAHSDEYYRERDLEFVANAKLLTLAGGKVFYNSSW